MTDEGNGLLIHVAMNRRLAAAGGVSSDLEQSDAAMGAWGRVEGLRPERVGSERRHVRCQVACWEPWPTITSAHGACVARGRGYGDWHHVASWQCEAAALGSG